jgi:hypothetical protein
MKRIVIASVCLFAISCASLPIKQQAVVSLQASELALESSHNLERSLCAPSANQAEAITTCNGPNAVTLGLTTERHQQLAAIYSKAFATEVLAANSLKAWKAGDPKPSSLLDYQKILGELLIALSQFIPNATELVSTTQSASDHALKTSSLVGK